MPGVYTPGEPNLAPGAMTGLEQIPVDTQLASGITPATAYINTGSLGFGFQTVAAFGASQGNATAITLPAGTVSVTVTASTEGVKLPVASTGARFMLLADPSVGAKVYAATGGKIGAATTASTAYALVKNTATTFVGVDATHWRVFKGG